MPIATNTVSSISSLVAPIPSCSSLPVRGQTEDISRLMDQACHPVVGQLVAGHTAPALGDDQPTVSQLGEVLGDVGLTLFQLAFQVRDAEFPLRDPLENLQTRWMPHRLQEVSQTHLVFMLCPHGQTPMLKDMRITSYTITHHFSSVKTYSWSSSSAAAPAFQMCDATALTATGLR